MNATKSKKKIKLTQTKRGFAYGKFTDKYGQECSIQKSSRMADGPGDECIWLGVNNNDGKFVVMPHMTRTKQEAMGLHEGWNEKCLRQMFPDCDISIPDRMHLTQTMVKALLPALQHFAETGELPVDKE